MAQQGPVPAEVVARLNTLALSCRALGGQPVRGAKPVAQPLDLTGDGRQDWVIEERAFACNGRNPLLARPLGTRVTVLVDDGRGRMIAAWEGRPAEVVVSRERAAVFIAEGGAECRGSQAAALACARVLRWDAAGKRMIASADLPGRAGSAGGPAQAAVAPTSLPPAVLAVHREYAAECVQMRGKAVYGGGFETRADLNGDGRDDYILDFSLYSCAVPGEPPSAGNGLCGSAGCPVEVVVSTPSGYRKDWSGYVQAWEVDRATQPASLRLAAHGILCNHASGADTCFSRLAWNGRQLANRPDRTARFTRDEEPQAPPAPPAPSAGKDITAAGFPFRAGVYTNNGKCDANAGGYVEFMKQGLHEWEADQDTSFTRIAQIAPGKYRVTEVFNGDDGPGEAEAVDYERLGPNSFRRSTSRVWDERSERMVPGRTIETYTYCQPLDR